MMQQPKLPHVGKAVSSSVNFQGSETAKLKQLFCARNIEISDFPSKEENTTLCILICCDYSFHRREK